MKTSTPAPLFSALGLVSIVMILGGCSAYNATAHGLAETTYTSATDFAKEHSSASNWLPADATSIKMVDSTRTEDTTTIRYESSTEAKGCQTVPRKSFPTMSIDTDIDVYSIDSVLLCDNWVIAHDSGQWVAWTPATEAE